MKKLLLSIIVLLFCAFGLFAQQGDFEPKLPDFIPPSPTAFELGKYGDIPVNESTGMANISVPLYTFSTPNISVPIGMSYITSGVKVDQVASWVGMGWNLNAGATISRTVRGMPDEDASVRSFPVYSSLMALKNSTYPSDRLQYYTHIKKMAKKDYADYVPDLFNFNIDGYSGSFFLDAGMSPRLIKEESELKIEIIGSSILNGFTITTPRGLKYTFDIYEESKQRMVCGSGNSNPEVYKPTSWLLTKITHPFGDEVTLTYANTSNYFYTSKLSETYNKNIGTAPGGASMPSEGVSKCAYDTYVKGKILTKISSNRNVGEVIFTSTTTRSDVSDYKLDAITIKDQINRQLKQFTFNYTQVQSSTSYNGASSFPHTTGSDKQYRLFLDDITEKDANNNASNGRKYSFEYESITSLPRRLSLSQDLLGYFNGKTNYSLLPNTHGASYNITRGDRSFDFNSAKKGILNKIIYPTKGYTILEYESGQSAIRIKKVKSLAKSGGTEKITRYYYTSKETALSGGTTSTEVPIGTDGFIVTKPSMVQYEVEQGPGFFVNYEYYFDRIEFTANGTAQTQLTNANHFLYSTVTVGYGDNFEGGGIEKKFSVVPDTDGSNLYGTIILNGNRTNSGLLNGTLIVETHFKKNETAADIKKKVEYYYFINETMSLTFDSYIGNVNFDSPTSNADGSWDVLGYNVDRIQTISKWRSIDSVVTKEYLSSGTLTTYQKSKYYSGFAGLPSETITTNSYGMELKTRSFYPNDVSQTNSLGFDVLTTNELNAITKLNSENQHRVGIPVQVQSYKNGILLNTIRTNFYEPTANIIVPQNIQTDINGTTLEDRVTYHSYYANGNVKEVSKKDGTRVVYIWGYNETKPIAKIENVTYSQVQNSVSSLQSLSNADNDMTYGSAGNEGALRAALESLRTSLPSNSQMTYYTYDPLIGVTSVTDVRGKTTYYHYNSFGRLQYVRDHNNKVLTKNEYNYKN